MNSFRLPPRFEDVLRRGVVAVGGALERAIEAAEKITSSIRSSALTAQPVLSLEGQIPIPKLKEILNQASDRIISGTLTSLVDKTSLEIREGTPSLARIFREKGASIAMHADMGGGAGSYGAAVGGAVSIRCAVSRLPFENGFFDYAAGIYANQYQGDILKVVREFSRVLAIAGEGVIVDFHPFGMYAKRGSLRLRPATSTMKGIEDYYKVCKAASLKVFDVKEAFLDETLRPSFTTEDEKQAYRIVKDTPLLIFLFVRKGA